MFNLHYLELFYYVARWGGVSQAARKMPYSVQQPSLSRQLKQLEEQAGVVLFQRRPFQLTLTGEKLYGVVKSFFDALHGVTDQIRAGVPEPVRIASTPTVLRHHLPPLLRKLDPRSAGIRFTLKEGLQSQIAQWFECCQIDLAVTVLEGDLPRGCQSELLLRLPMALLVPADSPYRSASQLWQRRRFREPIISPPPEDAVTRCFAHGLNSRAIRWEIGVAANSIGLVESYVAQGFGVGLSVSAPGVPPAPGTRRLPLTGFPTVRIGMIWSHQPSPVLESLKAHLRHRATQLRSIT